MAHTLKLANLQRRVTVLKRIKIKPAHINGALSVCSAFRDFYIVTHSIIKKTLDLRCTETQRGRIRMSRSGHY